MMISLEDARALDAADPLAQFRARFRLPDGLIYLDGNSLGPLAAAAPARLAEVAERQWGDELVASWNDPDWLDAPARIGGKLAHLLGAGADEVIATGESTSANLFKLVVAAAALAPGAIVAEADNFPTDAYIAAEAARLLDRPFRAVAGAELADALDDASVAVVTHVNYRSGARADMPALEAAARAGGARIVWDLSHSTGAVPLDLARDGAALAVGCTYKFLNGGPGAPAYLYAARTLHDRLQPPVAGWWGHAAPFAFESAYRPAPGIARFLNGTPPMLSLLASECGIDLALEADMGLLQAKSAAMFDLLAAAADAARLEVVTPRDPALRGSQIALAHPQAYAIIQALIARGVVGDYREPGIARFGLTPLYTSFEDIARTAAALAQVMRGREWAPAEHGRRNRVT